jgi:transposase-like protein
VYYCKRLLAMAINGQQRFPCPLCGEGLDVRETKKKKPYVVCDPCGIQLFVRGERGIRQFEQLVEKGQSDNFWAKIEALKERYRKKCPSCRKEFWIEERLIETSVIHGGFNGYRCPDPDCDGVVRPEDEA